MARVASSFAIEQSTSVGQCVRRGSEFGIVRVPVQAQGLERGFIFLGLGFLENGLVVFDDGVLGLSIFHLGTFLHGGKRTIFQGIAAQDRALVSGQSLGR